MKKLFIKFKRAEREMSRGSTSWVKTSALKYRVYRLQAKWIKSQGGGTWGRPLYDTGLLHRLLRNPEISLKTSARGSVSLKIYIPDSRLDGRQHLYPRFNLYNTEGFRKMMRKLTFEQFDEMMK